MRIALYIVGGIGAFVGVLILLFGLSFIGLEWRGILGKRAEQIRYDIHKQSQTYRDGMQRNLAQLQTDYLNADQAGKAAIAATIRHQYSQVDTTNFPPHLREFLSKFGV